MYFWTPLQTKIFTENNNNWWVNNDRVFIFGCSVHLNIEISIFIILFYLLKTLNLRNDTEKRATVMELLTWWFIFKCFGVWFFFNYRQCSKEIVRKSIKCHHKISEGCIFITVVLNIWANMQMLSPNGVLNEIPGGML